MNRHVFSGLTWNHPRGYKALESAASGAHDYLIEWRRQPLEGFESHPIADLAGNYDLLVMDHPHLGEAVKHSCLRPIEQLASSFEMDIWARATIGRSLESYRWQGRHFALPLDVAAQVMARDPQKIPEPPDTWDEVIRLSERQSVALSIAGPHALLTFFSLCLSLGEEPGGADLAGDDVGMEAIRLMARLVKAAPIGSGDLNPIGLIEAVAGGNGIVLVPLVFGYVNYAAAAPGRGQVAFSDSPRMDASGPRGSVLGGTGIAVTRRTSPDDALIAYLHWLMSPEAQIDFIPTHDGQPSARAAWKDDAVNRRWSDFYRSTISTVEQAWVRPRFDGYIAFQSAASYTLREALIRDAPSGEILSRLRSLWRSAPSGEHAPPSQNNGTRTL